MNKLGKKGFTLIELLAVIVILGVIMLIAIPSVSSIIANSRANTMKSTAEMLISGAKNMVLSSSDGKPKAAANQWVLINAAPEGKTTSTLVAATEDTSAEVVTNGSYYILAKNISIESGSNTKGPYGEKFVEDYSYVLAVSNTSGGYDYYVQLADEKGNLIPITKESAVDGVSVLSGTYNKTSVAVSLPSNASSQYLYDVDNLYY